MVIEPLMHGLTRLPRNKPKNDSTTTTPPPPPPPPSSSTPPPPPPPSSSQIDPQRDFVTPSNIDPPPSRLKTIIDQLCRQVANVDLKSVELIFFL